MKTSHALMIPIYLDTFLRVFVCFYFLTFDGRSFEEEFEV